MPVRKVSPEEMLGDKALVMTASPAVVRGLRKLRDARIQNHQLAAAKDPPGEDQAQA